MSAQHHVLTNDTSHEEAVPFCTAELDPFKFYSVEQSGLEARSYLMKNTSEADLSKKRPRSDSELSEIAEEDAGSDFDIDEDAQSDGSFDSVSRKKRKGAESSRKRFKTPEDNEMRQKLRVSGHQAHISATEEDSRAPSLGRDHVSETESLTDEEADPTLVPERSMPPEEESMQKERLKTSWELVTILDFLSIFQPYLNLQHLNFSAEELESCLVLNNGASGLLPELHMGIMKGISTRSNLHLGNWAASLAEKLKLYWRAGRLPGIPPFKPQRRWEAVDYANLPLSNRVTALRILCELRLEKDDLHSVVEQALHPPRKTKAEKKAEALAAQSNRRPPPEPPQPKMEHMRRQPLAKDSSGLMYWYLDYHTTTGTRLYREIPDHLIKLKSKKEQAEPQWDLLASSPEDMIELGEKLRRSKKKADQNLANLILEEILPELLDRREADLKKQRAAAKVQAQLNNILPSGRSRRARKEVNYSFDAYDAAIRAALRQGSADPEERRPTRSTAFLECRMTAEEELQLGLRRGRSARAASPPLDLPPNRRVRQTEGLRNPARLSMEPSSERGNASVTPSEDQPAQRASEEDDPSASPSPLPAADQRILNGISSTSGNPNGVEHGLGKESVEVEISDLDSEEISRDGIDRPGNMSNSFESSPAIDLEMYDSDYQY